MPPPDDKTNAPIWFVAISERGLARRGIAAVLVSLAVAVIMVAGGPWWLAVALLSLVVGEIFVAAARYARIARGIGEDPFRCPGCFYPLSQLGPDGNCPECGRPFVRDELPDEWVKAMTGRDVNGGAA